MFMSKVLVFLYYLFVLHIAYCQTNANHTKELVLPKKVFKKIEYILKKSNYDKNNYIPILLSIYDIEDFSLIIYIDFVELKKHTINANRDSTNLLNFAEIYGYKIKTNKKGIIYLIDLNMYANKTGLSILCKCPYIIVKSNKIKKISINGY